MSKQAKRQSFYAKRRAWREHRRQTAKLWVTFTKELR